MKSLDIWLASYVADRVRKRRWRRRISDVLFCFVDHFEPVACRDSTVERERRRMQAWVEGYPRLAARHRDSDGVPPQHTWFYPAEDYRAEYLNGLSELCGRGFGEVELHLHHGHDTPASLRRRLEEGVALFNRHGALITRDEPPVRTYGFIHGNLALDNSRGNPALCGVDSELDILQETGCYADFSLPTAPARSQTRKVNAIYYATDDPGAPKSHDRGVDAEVGVKAPDGLLLIQGPLALDWRRRKFGVLPRIDNGDVGGTNPGTPSRVRRWVRQHVHVRGRPEWVVVKVSCHGAEEHNFDALLDGGAERLFTSLEAQCRDALGVRLHYVTARELYNVIKAAEAGRDGDPGAYRDFLIPPYRNTGRAAAALETAP